MYYTKNDVDKVTGALLSNDYKQEVNFEKARQIFDEMGADKVDGESLIKFVPNGEYAFELFLTILSKSGNEDMDIILNNPPHNNHVQHMLDNAFFYYSTKGMKPLDKLMFKRDYLYARNQNNKNRKGD